MPARNIRSVPAFGKLGRRLRRPAPIALDPGDRVPWCPRPFAPIEPPPVELRFTRKSKWQVCNVKEPRRRLSGNITSMNHATLRMSEPQFGDPHVDTEIELLARETRMPRELVARLYTSARAKLERTARIKTYVPVLIHRQVKALLREQHRA
jgi:hypothetical protein